MQRETQWKKKKYRDEIQTIKHENVRQATGTGNHQMQPETLFPTSKCVQCGQREGALCVCIVCVFDKKCVCVCVCARYKNVTINTQMPRQTLVQGV